MLAVILECDERFYFIVRYYDVQPDQVAKYISIKTYLLCMCVLCKKKLEAKRRRVETKLVTRFP